MELASGIQKCGRCCKELPFDHFKTIVRKGEEKLTAYCIKCIDKQLDYYEKGGGKAVRKRYRESDDGKDTMKTYLESEWGKGAQKRYRESDKGQDTYKTYMESEAGKARQERMNDVVKKRRAKDPAYKLSRNLQRLACGLVSGKQATSPTFLQHTAFASEAQFLKHMHKKVKAMGFRWVDYGITWEIEHIIPVEAYDFLKWRDVKRCWSRKNVRALAPEANMEKGVKLINKLCRKVGPAHFPLSWKGVLLTREQKEAFYAKRYKSWGSVESEE